MDKKSVSATILVIFLSILFTVIGASFSYFVYKEKMTVVSAVAITSVDGIGVYYDEALTKNASSLKLSSMDLGLKPVTGELDAETQIPSTIDDKGTSEGYYATIFVKSDIDFKIVIDNINIDSDHDESLIEEEKKNIFIGILDLKDSVTTLEENDVEIASFENVSEPKKLVFLIWLGSLASDELEGAKISFNISFLAK